MDEILKLAAAEIRAAQRIVAFTGAGISVESGIPPFRGPGGLWSKYDPSLLDIGRFHTRPGPAWLLIKEIFYDFFGRAEPNAAHRALAALQARGKMDAVITQNIDNLHQAAGSSNVIEYHGTSHRLICIECGRTVRYTPELLEQLPPRCQACDGVLKPDFVFFGEQIPAQAQEDSMVETLLADVWLVIGTTGTIMPACMLPVMAKQNGMTIIEVNIRRSEFTGGISDLFLQGKATEIMSALLAELDRIP